jgi:hypothetical protein
LFFINVPIILAKGILSWIDIEGINIKNPAQRNKNQSMLTQDELIESPDYLLTKYQNEIFRQLRGYMEDNKLSKKDVRKN